MKQVDLKFSLKGNRDYVHGSDIFKKIMNELSVLGYDNWRYFEFKLSKITHNNMTCFLAKKRQRAAGEVISFFLRRGEEQLFGSIIENDEKITSRYQFNENDITENCELCPEQKSVTYNNPENSFATIDVLFSTFRFYLECVVDNSVNWYFLKLSLSETIEKIESRKIWLKEIARKGKIIVIDIYIDSQIIGRASVFGMPK